MQSTIQHRHKNVNGSIFQADEVINIYIKYVPIDVKSIASKNTSAGSNLWLCIRIDCSMKHNFLSCKKFDHSIHMRVTIYIAKQLKSFQVLNILFSSKTCLNLLSVIENVDAGKRGLDIANIPCIYNIFVNSYDVHFSR